MTNHLSFAFYFKFLTVIVFEGLWAKVAIIIWLLKNGQILSTWPFIYLSIYIV